MRRIYKYPLMLTQIQVVTMPKGSAIRHIHGQRIDRGWFAVIWAEHTAWEKLMEHRTIFTMLTGEAATLPVGSTYLGTAHLYDGEYVVHLYELPRGPALTDTPTPKTGRSAPEGE